MALGTQTHGKRLDYEQYIDYRLGRTQAEIKKTDVLTAALTLATAALAVLFLEIVLDHAIGLPIWSRQLILFGGLAAAGLYAGLRIVRPSIRQISGLYAAKTIEGVDPAFKNSLINYIELRKYRNDLPKRVLRAVEAKAVGDLTKVDLHGIVNQHRVLRTFYALLGVVVLVSLYVAVTPKSIVASAKRAFLADVVRPTDTRLEHIKPGDDSELSEVVAGTHVPFSVEVQGVRPARVTLHHSVDGGSFYAAQEFAPGPNPFDPWQTSIRNIQQDVDYYVSAGDAESRHYRIHVLPAPMVSSVALDYQFPSYTGVAERRGIEGGVVDAIEGTMITVHARTNQPARAGHLDFGNQRTLDMTVNAEDPTRLSGRFKVEAEGSYSIKFRTTGGQVNPEPVIYDIHASKDQGPGVRFVSPAPRIKAPSNGRVPLQIEANDDFGIKSLVLSVSQGSESLVSRDLWENKKPERKVAVTEVLDLQALKLKPGTQVEYWLVARDNKEPQSNSAPTEKQIIEITEPLPPEQLAKLDEEARKDNPPPPADAQPQLPRDPEAPQPEQVQNSKDGGRQSGEQAPDDDKRVARNDPPPTTDDRRPDADNRPQHVNDQPSPEDQRKIEELARKLGLDKPNPNTAQKPDEANPGDDRNPGSPPQGGNPAQNQPDNKTGAGSSPPRPGASADKSQTPQANPPGDSGTTPPSPANGRTPGNTQDNQVSKANPDQAPAQGGNPPAPQNGNLAESANNGEPRKPGDPTPSTSRPTPGSSASPSSGTPNAADARDPRKPEQNPGARGDSSAGQNTNSAQPNTQPPGGRPNADQAGTRSGTDRQPADRPKTEPVKPVESNNQSGGNQTKGSSSNAGAQSKQSTGVNNASNPTAGTERKPIDPIKDSGGAEPQPKGATSNAPQPGENSAANPKDASEQKATNLENGNNSAEGSPGENGSSTKANRSGDPSKDRTGAGKQGNQTPQGNSGNANDPTKKPGDPTKNPNNSGAPGNPATGSGEDSKAAGGERQPGAEEKSGTDGRNPGPAQSGSPSANPSSESRRNPETKPGTDPNGKTTPTDPNANPGADRPDSASGEAKVDPTKAGTPSSKSARPPGGSEKGSSGDKSNSVAAKGQDTPSGEAKVGDPRTPGESPNGDPRKDQKDAADSGDVKSDNPPAGQNRPGEMKADGSRQGDPKAGGAQSNADPSNPAGIKPEADASRSEGRPDGKPSAATQRPGEQGKVGDASAPAKDPNKGNAPANATNPSGAKPKQADRPSDGSPTPTGEASTPKQGTPESRIAPTENARPQDRSPQGASRDPSAEDKVANPSGAQPGSETKRMGNDPTKPQTGDKSPPTGGNPQGTPSENSASKPSSPPQGDARPGRATSDPDQQLKSGDDPSAKSTESKDAASSKGMPNSDPSSPPAGSQASRQGEKPSTPTQSAPGQGDPKTGQPGNPENKEQAPSTQPGSGERAGQDQGEGQGNKPGQGGEKGPGQAKPGQGQTPGKGNESGQGEGKGAGEGKGTKPGQGGITPGSGGEPQGQGTSPAGQEGGQGSHGNPSPGGSQPGSGKAGSTPPTGSGSPNPGGQTPGSRPGGNPQAGSPSGKGSKGGQPSAAGTPGSPSGEGFRPGERQGNAPGGVSPDGGQPGTPQGNNDPRDPSDQPGNSGATNNPNGGGPMNAPAPLTPGGKDESQPLPPVRETAPSNPDPSIAPDVPQSDLVLRSIREMLRDDKFTPDVERQTGMSKDEAEQFVKKFTKKAQPDAPGPGREIKARPGQDRVFDPTRKAPEFQTKATVSNRNERSGTSLPQDNLSGLSTGARTLPPPELRRHVKAYHDSLGRSVPVQPAAPAPNR